MTGPEPRHPKDHMAPDEQNLDAAPAETRERDDVVEVEIVGPSADVLDLDLPDGLEPAQVVLLDAVASARSEAGESLEQLQRLAAEYDNFRRRAERDRQELLTFAAKRIVEQLLPTLDNFEAALAYQPQGDGEVKLMAGMTGTYNQLKETLETYGFAEVESVGAPFDPALHEAISGPTDGDGALIVDQELRRGYTIDGKVVRPALVTVRYGDLEEEHGGTDDA